MEYWQPIENFPGYSISDHGRVWSDRTHKELAHFKKKGYHYVELSRAGVKHRLRVHVLVAKHWLDGDRSESVNHKDLNKDHNHCDNLEWMTLRDNALHAWANGANDHLRRVDLETLRSMRAAGATQREIGAAFGVSQPAIHYLLAKMSSPP
jgi:hypothetical protein